MTLNLESLFYCVLMATRIIEPMQLDNVEDWLERLDQAISCCIVQEKLTTEETKNSYSVSLLLSNIGQMGYKVLKSYCAPDKPAKKSYDDLVKLLTENLAPALDAVSEGFRFNLMKQESGEGLSLYMSRVKEKANVCNFGTFYDRMVKDRFLYGLRDSNIRSYLLTKADLNTSAKVLTAAIAKENAMTANSAMSGSGSAPSAHFVHKKHHYGGQSKQGQNKGYRPGDKGLVCSKCTLKGHKAPDCKVKCRNCHQTGHIKANCLKGKRPKQNNVGEADDDDVYGDQVHEYMMKVDVLSEENQVVNDCFPVCNPDLSPEPCIYLPVDPVNYSLKGNSAPDFEPSPDENVSSNSMGSSSLREAESAVSYECTVECMSTRSSRVCSVCESRNMVCHFRSRKPMILLLLNGKPVEFELDTGAALTCISKTKFSQLNLNDCKLIDSVKTLCVANGQTVNVCMIAKTSVKFNGTSHGEMNLHVVDSCFPTLLGRDWIERLFGPEWFGRLVNAATVSTSECHEKFAEEMKKSPIFMPGIGVVKGYEARLNLKEGARPKFCKARVTAFSIRGKTEDTLKQMIAEGLLVPVDNSEWASPIVPVAKPDKTIRVCGDYKSTLNPALDTKTYPLPTVDECFAGMVGGKLFSKIDIKSAYNSLLLRKCDQALTTLNTQLGLLMWTRLPFGINSAGAQFQATIDEVLTGIRQTCCRVDDILITGFNDEEHMSNVRQVIKRLEDAGFRCRLDKSEFMQPSVIYLGHVVSAQGIKPVSSKVETLVKAPFPETREQLVSFLGAVQYYARYLPNMSTVIEPLNQLRSAQTKWVFGKEQQEAFNKLKEMLTSERVLAFYDPSVPLKVDCDASSVGLGGVISHKYSDGTEKPIEFVSRTLTDAERRYSQLDREALAIIWSLKKFHKYVYAVHFQLVTDNKPLQYILHQNKGIPEMVISRLQRWALILANYDYTISYRPTGKHANADVCSRFPLKIKDTPASTHPDSLVCDGVYECETCKDEIYTVFVGEDKPLLNSALISKMSRTDPILAKVILFTLEGWPKRPNSVKKKAVSGDSSEEKEDKRPKVVKNKTISGDSFDAAFKPYYEKQTELSVDKGCLMWGGRVIIPTKMRPDVLELLHSTHMGSSAMKNMARRYMWWPLMDAEIEKVSKTCKSCQSVQPLPKKALPHPWDVPDQPWQRLHLDFAGPFQGSMWLIVVCAYSKWLEVKDMKQNTTAANLIKKLRELFACFGLPKVCVMDNGPQLSRSTEFVTFLSNNGIKCVPIPSYHPSSNGQAENQVLQFKRAIKKMIADHPGDITTKLSQWLFQYRNTPHSTTGIEPAVLMFGRRPRTALSLLNPCTNDSKYEEKVAEQREKLRSQPLRSFDVGDKVYYRDVRHNKWNEGVVQSLEGSKIVIIEAEGQGSLVRKHLDHVVKRVESESKPVPPPIVALNNSKPDSLEIALHNGKPDSVDHSLGQTSTEVVEKEQTKPDGITVEHEPRPRRHGTAPDRLSYDKLGGR